MNLYLLTPPAVEPVEPDDAKLALRIDGTEFDDLLPALISSARQVAEQRDRAPVHRADPLARRAGRLARSPF